MSWIAFSDAMSQAATGTTFVSVEFVVRTPELVAMYVAEVAAGNLADKAGAPRRVDRAIPGRSVLLLLLLRF